MEKLRSMLDSIKEVFSNKNYLLIFVVISILFFSLFVAIPFLTIPGNDLLYQLSIFTFKDYFLLSILSFLSSILITTQIYLYRIKRVKLIGKGAAGSSSGIVAAIFGTASCSSCLAAIFGFLGIGTIIALTQYQWVITSAAIVLMLVSLYFTLSKFNSCCEVVRK